jgi:3-keto-5-aminohexanoate cleavage enzyme
MTPLVLMVAPNGARRTKIDHPELPITPQQLAAEAARCMAAGATALHLHVRDDEGLHSLDPDRYRAAMDAIRAEIGEAMVIQITTEAVGRYHYEEQMAVVRQVRPEAVSLALTELIPDDDALDGAADFLGWLRRERIAPQYILYSPTEVVRFHDLRRRGVIPQERPFAIFVLGRYATPSQAVHPRDLLPYLKAHDMNFPWAVCAFGAVESACVLTAAGLEGHARVGFENNLWRADGQLASSNAELVQQVATGVGLLGRQLADIGATRSFLAATAA